MDEQRTVLHTVKNMGLNLASLSLESLHALHYGVMEELRIREQRALTDVSEFKVNNQQLFIEKTQDLKEKEALQAHSSHMESVVVEACKLVPKLHIPKEAQLEAKVRKLAASMCDSIAKVG